MFREFNTMILHICRIIIRDEINIWSANQGEFNLQPPWLRHGSRLIMCLAFGFLGFLFVQSIYYAISVRCYPIMFFFLSGRLIHSLVSTVEFIPSLTFDIHTFSSACYVSLTSQVGALKFRGANMTLILTRVFLRVPMGVETGVFCYGINTILSESQNSVPAIVRFGYVINVKNG